MKLSLLLIILCICNLLFAKTSSKADSVKSTKISNKISKATIKNSKAAKSKLKAKSHLKAKKTTNKDISNSNNPSNQFGPVKTEGAAAATGDRKFLLTNEPGPLETADNGKSEQPVDYFKGRVNNVLKKDGETWDYKFYGEGYGNYNPRVDGNPKKDVYNTNYGKASNDHVTNQIMQSKNGNVNLVSPQITGAAGPAAPSVPQVDSSKYSKMAGTETRAGVKYVHANPDGSISSSSAGSNVPLNNPPNYSSMSGTNTKASVKYVHQNDDGSNNSSSSSASSSSSSSSSSEANSNVGKKDYSEMPGTETKAGVQYTHADSDSGSNSSSSAGSNVPNRDPSNYSEMSGTETKAGLEYTHGSQRQASKRITPGVLDKKKDVAKKETALKEEKKVEPKSSLRKADSEAQNIKVLEKSIENLSKRLETLDSNKKSK